MNAARPVLCIYHGACRDGFCAAWVVHRVHPKADFFAGFYGQPPPDVTGRAVVLVDFSYPRDVLEDMASKAASLLILDHHKTAEEALRGFADGKQNASTVFDMHRSGAGLAWDYFFSGAPRPWLVDYVEDRDLWRHRLDDSKTINAWLALLPFDFAPWDMAAQAELDVAREGGSAALMKTEQYVREVAKNARAVRFRGYSTRIVNAPQVDISELLDELARQSPDLAFVMGWWQRADRVFQYSLRSRGDFDVSELARQFGGGGHKNAAGFQVDELLDLLPEGP